MNILIFFPYNQRTVEQQSVIELLKKSGHEVFLLTLAKEGFLHSFVASIGVKAYSTNSGEDISLKNIIGNSIKLVRFCRQNKIDVIFAHQQICALPLIFALPFIKSTSYYFRHNTDEGYEQNAKAKWLNKFINRFVPHIIAPSNIVYDFLIAENVPAKKITRINYGYNFAMYEKNNPAISKEIRHQYPCNFLVISIARLVPAKRHYMMFEVIKQLVKQGNEIKMICLGQGIIKADLQKWIDQNNLSPNIFLLGIKNNVMDYLSAGDVLLHLSETEASNSVVKEAALAKKAAIVCKAVGDFEDYITSHNNGFLVSKANPTEEAINIINTLVKDPALLKNIGQNAYTTITTLFDIQNVGAEYSKLLN